MAKLDLSGIREFEFSENGRIRFKADDKLRGETAVMISDPRDVKELAELFLEVLAQMQSGIHPEAVGYVRVA